MGSNFIPKTEEIGISSSDVDDPTKSPESSSNKINLAHSNADRATANVSHKSKSLSNAKNSISESREVASKEKAFNIISVSTGTSPPPQTISTQVRTKRFTHACI